MKIGDTVYCIRDYYSDERYGMGNISYPSTYTKGLFYRVQKVFENTYFVEDDQHNFYQFAKVNGYFLTQKELRKEKLQNINDRN